MAINNKTKVGTNYNQVSLAEKISKLRDETNKAMRNIEADMTSAFENSDTLPLTDTATDTVSERVKFKTIKASEFLQDSSSADEESFVVVTEDRQHQDPFNGSIEAGSPTNPTSSTRVTHDGVNFIIEKRDNVNNIVIKLESSDDGRIIYSRTDNNTGEVVSGNLLAINGPDNMEVISNDDYEALATKNPNTVYLIPEE